jgi:hypothetical protein
MNELMPCLSGSKLLNQDIFIDYLIEIRSLISCPENIFIKLYLDAMYKFAEYCQAMPFSQTEFCDSYGYLNRQLQLAIAVLKLRRGVLLPRNAGAEIIAAEEAQWTFALFSATLLTDLYCLQSDREIKLYKADGNIVTECSFLSWQLNESKLYYQMCFVNKKPSEKIDIFMNTFIGRVISVMQVNWLRTNKFLFNQWRNTILQIVSPNNDIEALIKKAANKAGILLRNGKSPIEENTIISKNDSDKVNKFILDDINLKGWS